MTMTPLEVVDSALAAHLGADAPALAKLVDPETLATFKRQKLAFATHWILDHLRDLAVVGGGRASGDLLPSARLRRTRLAAIAQAPTIPELEALSPEDFFTRWADAWYRAITALHEYVAPRLPTLAGAVPEGEGIVHVLYRYEDAEIAPDHVQVATVHRVNGEWLLLAAPELAFDDRILDQLFSLSV